MLCACFSGYSFSNRWRSPAFLGPVCGAIEFVTWTRHSCDPFTPYTDWEERTCPRR
ncbi:hypothetical protein [Azospirillum argentinense]